VLDLLSQFTADPDHCFHALWEGWGWLDDGAEARPFVADRRGKAPAVPIPDAPPRELLDGARLHHPGRDYLLFEGPLRAALRIGRQDTPDSFWLQSPNLLWPADRSWCLGTEVDFDSTLIGCSQELIDALVTAPTLEAWPVGPRDDLTIEGDHINLRPAGFAEP
jgi:hypothetical protein